MLITQQIRLFSNKKRGGVQICTPFCTPFSNGFVFNMLGDVLLSHQDSNLNRQNQNLQCYHYTMGQSVFGAAKLILFLFVTKISPIIYFNILFPFRLG